MQSSEVRGEWALDDARTVLFLKRAHSFSCCTRGSHFTTCGMTVGLSENAGTHIC